MQSGIVAASVFTFQTVCSPIGVLTVDRLGRRKLMVISAIGMGSCMAIVAGTTSQGDNKAAEGVAGAMIFLFSMFFPVGFLGLTFLYASEISPLVVRVPITSLSTATAWIFNFMVCFILADGWYQDANMTVPGGRSDARWIRDDRMAILYRLRRDQLLFDCAL